jgi:hypothetical protein
MWKLWAFYQLEETRKSLQAKKDKVVLKKQSTTDSRIAGLRRCGRNLSVYLMAPTRFRLRKHGPFWEFSLCFVPSLSW